MREDKDALRVSFRVVEGGVGGLRTECDFWPRRLPGLGERKEDDGEGDGEGAAERAPNVCDLVDGGRRGGEGESRSFCSWRADDCGGFVGDLVRSDFTLVVCGLEVVGSLGGGILVLRLKSLDIFCWWALISRRLGLRSTSSSMTRPISKSSSGSGLAALTCLPTVKVVFFISKIFLSWRPPEPDSKRSEGMIRPSRSPSSSSSSSVSVSGSDTEEAEFDEGDASANPREE